MMTRRSMLLRTIASAALLAASRFLPMPSRPDDSKQPRDQPSPRDSVYMRKDGLLTLDPGSGSCVGVVIGERVSAEGETTSIVLLDGFHHWRTDRTDGRFDFSDGLIDVRLV